MKAPCIAGILLYTLCLTSSPAGSFRKQAARDRLPAMKTRSLFVPLLLSLVPALASSQMDSLKASIRGIIDRASGQVGVAIIGPGSRDTLAWNGNGRFPMQSVYKIPLALAVLDRVDHGTLALGQKVRVTSGDLLPNTWSPLRDKYPHGNVEVTLDELLRYTVSESDNNGCDILFRVLGGTERVQRYLRGLGVDGMAVVATEAEMHREWDVQFRNWSTPLAMASLLSMAFHDRILSDQSRGYLWRLMVETGTGPARLKGQLPGGVIVAHKTGSSGIGENGIAAATNDVGIVVLPGGGHCVIAVFVSNSPAQEDARDEVIAGIARAAWEFYTGR